MKTRKVYLVGAGPGSPDLITVKGLEILRQADVVIYDYLVDKRLPRYAAKGAELICCHRLGNKRFKEGFFRDQDEINKIIMEKVKEGKRVVRLRNGDSAIFSRISEELETLTKNNIEFEIVPGVTAASAAACFSGVPLTDRRFASNVVFVTGHEAADKESNIDWKSIAGCGTIVLYMAVANLFQIVRQLLNAGKTPTTPVAIIQDASLLTQKVLVGTLRDIVTKAKEQKIKPPAIIIIGEVVRLEKRFNWLIKNKRILFTGLSKERFFTKGTFFHLPLIKIEPLGNYADFDNCLKDIAEFDWIVFCSRYGVQYFFQRLNKIGYDARRLNKIKIAAIGGSTQNRLLDYGILADLVPKEESSRGLINEFKKIDIKDKRIFLLRSDLSDKGFKQALEKQGARVISAVAYRNVMPENLPELNLESFDEIMFTSPSGVRNFRKRYTSVPKKVKVSCIGNITFKEAKKCHLVD